MTRKEMKAAAKASIKGNIWKLFVVFLIMAVILGVLELVPVVGILAYVFVAMPGLTLGILTIYFKVANNESYEIKNLFDGFKNWKDVWAMFKVMFLNGLYVLLWSLLLYIPGIIKSFSYSQSQLIMAENPTMGANEAITLSRKMMDGHKWEYFVFILSFIGWILLVTVTFGIAGIYVIPYMQTAQINFYKKVKAEYAAKEANMQ